MNATSPLAASLLVAVGGGAGAVLRYQSGRLVSALTGPAAAAFPWATLLVNVAGSLAMGLLAGWLARQGSGTEMWRLLLGVGLLGGFTTFSAFSLDMIELIGRGSPALALAYAGLSVGAGLGALWLGLMMTRIAA